MYDVCLCLWFLHISDTLRVVAVPGAELAEGAEYTVPDSLAVKLARFHLIDCVRGE